MKGFKRQEWIILVLEAVFMLLLIFCLKDALTEKVVTWSTGMEKEAEEAEEAKEAEDGSKKNGERENQKKEQGIGSGSGENTEQEEKKIAITFDDGPSPIYTVKLLDGLKERDVKATFFVLGMNAEKYPEIIERMQKEGHLIGNHTYSHIQLRSSNRQKFRDELIKTNEIISGITGKEVQYVRPPYGTWDKELEEELNMFPVLWNVDPNDWCTSSTDCVIRNITEKAKENSIILLHDCYQSSVDGALASIDILQERGFEFVTVEELLFD